jgi:hypothetical protein
MDLMKDEVIVYETRILRSSCIALIFVGIIASFAIIGIPLLIYWIHTWFKRIILTNKRFIIKGWFSTNEIRLDKIETVSKSGLTYTVKISGSGGSKMRVQNVENPQKLVNEIHEALDLLKK